MSGPLWSKPGMSVDDAAMAFMSGDDVVLDRELFPFDIRATRAHVRGLQRVGLLTDADAQSVEQELGRLLKRFEDGSFVLDGRFEDGHSAIEAALTERLGDAGKRVHLGRSRNDQVAVALRLYMKDVLGRAGTSLMGSARAALMRAEADEMTPMPGFTHLQRAVPSSVGLWMASFAEGFGDAAALCAHTSDWLDACPLGTAAGYGVNLPLDREGVAEELGFSRVQVNPMAAQAARGRTEAQALMTLWQAAQELRRLAWDLSLFSSEEYGFVTLAPAYVTGSSIMPNKRNPDMAELLRGVAGVVGGALAEIQQTVSLPSGYHRDVQWTKAPLVRACTVTLAALGFVPEVIRTLELHRDRMRSAIDASMFATDRAVELAGEGVPFREAYVQAAESIGSGTAAEVGASLRARVSLGGCGNLGLDRVAKRLDEIQTRF